MNDCSQGMSEFSEVRTPFWCRIAALYGIAS